MWGRDNFNFPVNQNNYEEKYDQYGRRVVNDFYPNTTTTTTTLPLGQPAYPHAQQFQPQYPQQQFHPQQQTQYLQQPQQPQVHLHVHNYNQPLVQHQYQPPVQRQYQPRMHQRKIYLGADDKLHQLLNNRYEFNLMQAMELIDKGANPDVQNNEGNTILHTVIKRLSNFNNDELYENALYDLIDIYDADINIKNNSGLTPVNLFHGPNVIKLSRSQLRKLLGKGSYSKVYKAFVDSEKFERHKEAVAIKMLSPESSKGFYKTSFANYYKEVKLMTELKGEDNVIQLIGLCEKARTKNYYICMEFYALGSLSDYISENDTIDWSLKIKIIKGIIYGLEAIHRHGIVHRDLKPQNILLNSEKEGVIADLGCAYKQEGGLESNFSDVMLHMAPELYRDKPIYYTYAQDVWSFGITVRTIDSWKPMRLLFPKDLKNKDEFLEFVNSNSFSISPNAPEFMTRIMVNAQNLKPEDRPTTKQIKEFFLSQSENYLAKQRVSLQQQISLPQQQTQQQKQPQPNILEPAIEQYSQLPNAIQNHSLFFANQNQTQNKKQEFVVAINGHDEVVYLPPRPNHSFGHQRQLDVRTQTKLKTLELLKKLKTSLNNNFLQQYNLEEEKILNSRLQEQIDVNAEKQIDLKQQGKYLQEQIEEINASQQFLNFDIEENANETYWFENLWEINFNLENINQQLDELKLEEIDLQPEKVKEQSEIISQQQKILVQRQEELEQQIKELEAQYHLQQPQQNIQLKRQGDDMQRPDPTKRPRGQ